MDENADSGLPRVVELLLGARERPRRGPKPGLSLERIVQAAIGIADAEGLAALSMARVAEELGFTTMSLYRYVRSKEELLLLMVNGAAGELPEISEGGWRGGLTRWARELLASYRRHPWVLQVPISGPPFLPSELAWMDQGLRALTDTRLDEAEKLAVIQLLAVYVRGEAHLAQQLAQAVAAAQAASTTEQGRGEAATAATGYGQLLRQMVDPQRLPALSQVLAAGVFDGPIDCTDADSDFGLQRVLDGIEVLIQARGHG
ncbi:MAG TPA: TetR/AcrR family transcriptional regulator [Micromonosporaceae bacterium]|nr:TetR/AcrR family transcriptional regulator [Micromonosporaceae bacterium]